MGSRTSRASAEAHAFGHFSVIVGDRRRGEGRHQRLPGLERIRPNRLAQNVVEAIGVSRAPTKAAFSGRAEELKAFQEESRVVERLHLADNILRWIR